MDLFRNKYRIDSARLADWDYSSNGFYFVTICTKNREPYFGTIQNTNLTRNETQSSLSGNETQSSLSGNETQSSLSGNETQSSLSRYETQSSLSGNETQSSLSGNETQSSLSGNETQSSLSGNETQNLASLQATDIGRIASQYWSEIPVHFPFVELDEFIIMPDHLHGILLFNKNEQSTWQPNKAGPQSRNLASVIRGFKAGVKAYATTNEIEFQWQPRYYDRVIRNSNELERIRKYIADNPANWLSEKGNPENLYR